MGIDDQVESDRILVAVRVRPSKEDDQDFAVRVFASDNELFVENKRFTFDNVFDVNESQSAVFERSIRSIIEGCVDGFNATILAYGQTGSGKTYTMGTADSSVQGIALESGIIPRAVELLFSRLNERRNSCDEADGGPVDIRVQAQFVELYNEELRDLLDFQKLGKSQIKIHESAKSEIYLTGVSSRIVNSLDDTLRCLRDGCLVRTTACTNMNSTSSRSHAIFSLLVQQRLKIIGGATERRSAKIHFVDLAGSERMKRTGASGERAREGISINCGLLALGNVISALACASTSSNDGMEVGYNLPKERPKTHIPYRDSKLTRLLADSLGGNARTLMIACISPSTIDKKETCSTLQYASRIKKIRNRVTANRQVQDGPTISPAEVTALRERVRGLKERVSDLESELRAAAQRSSTSREVCGDHDNEHTNQLWREWEESISELDAKAAQMKHLTMRCHLRQQLTDRNRKLSQLHDSEDVRRAIARLESELLSLRGRRNLIELQHQKASQRAHGCRDHLLRYLHEMSPKFEAGWCAQQSQLRMAVRQADHCHRMCRYLLAHTGGFQRIVCSMMDLLRREHLLLMAHHAMTPELSQQYGEVVRQFEGGKRVCWNDNAEEDGTECSSLSSCNTDSEMTEKPEVLGGVFDLRSRDLSSWLEQCVQQSANQAPSDTAMRKKKKRRSGYYTKVKDESETPKVTYNLRPRRSGSYSTAVTSTPLAFSKPLQVSSVLNRTYDNKKDTEVLDAVSSVNPTFQVSRIRVDDATSEYITPPTMKPSRRLMTKTITKKRRRQPFSDIGNETPMKISKPSTDEGNNGLPLPVISATSNRVTAEPNVTKFVSSRPLMKNLPQTEFPSLSKSTTSSRRLSFIPRMNSQMPLTKRRATLFPGRE